jgi:16S rRNA (cytidine1402-2'-O)-methyltransferase
MEVAFQYLNPDTRLCIAAGIQMDEQMIKTYRISEWRKQKMPEIHKIPAIFLISP